MKQNKEDRDKNTLLIKYDICPIQNKIFCCSKSF